MALTKRQATKAGRLYGLAMVALTDGVAMDDDEIRAMQASRMHAEAALARLGFDKSQLLTIRDCIDAVRNTQENEGNRNGHERNIATVGKRPRRA